MSADVEALMAHIAGLEEKLAAAEKAAEEWREAYARDLELARVAMMRAVDQERVARAAPRRLYELMQRSLWESYTKVLRHDEDSAAIQRMLDDEQE